MSDGQLTSFIGRSRELAELEALFDRARLITLTGPGGSGKTRLALEFAARLPAEPAFVDLAPITDARMMPGAIAAVLGVREVAGEPIRETLVGRIGEQETVLVLDNLEQIPDAGLVIADLLAASPGLHILATSRVPLHVRGEHGFPVKPLERPAAVALFVDRARAIDPRFALTDDDAAVVAGICERLDGLPMAIELAAARTRLFTPATLLSRLDQHLPTLEEGPADAPDRQRTMRATIGWSFDLLSEHDQRVFVALGVFAGGFPLDAAEAIVVGPDDTHDASDVITSLEHLVDQSVLTVSFDADGESRFRMLETIRGFAWDQVPESDRIELRDRHLAYFVARAERAEPELRGPDQATWIRRLAAEQADIRTALTWAQEAHRDEQMLRLASALRRRFWYEAGGMTEGMRWLDAALAAGSDAPAALRAKALQRAAWIVWEIDEGERSQELFEASLAEADEDDHLSRLEALIGLGYQALSARGPGLDVAAERLDSAIELARRDGTPGAFVEPLIAQGKLAQARGDLTRAAACFADALEMAREAGDIWGAGSALLQSGTLALVAGDPARAQTSLEESLQLSIQSGDREVRSHASVALAEALTDQGDLAAARTQLGEGTTATRELMNPFGDLLLLEAAGGWLASAALLPSAVEAWGAAERYRADHRWPVATDEARKRRGTWSAAREAIGTVRFEMLWATGSSRDLRHAVDVAMASVDGADLQALPDFAPLHRRGRFDLTPREQEVLALVAEGMSDGEIAESLVISKKTASVHVANIKAKLGASSRVEVATIAVRESLT